MNSLKLIFKQKCFNSLAGRVMRQNGSEIYQCTTSAPSRLPVLVTGTSTVNFSLRLMSAFERAWCHRSWKWYSSNPDVRWLVPIQSVFRLLLLFWIYIWKIYNKAIPLHSNSEQWWNIYVHIILWNVRCRMKITAAVASCMYIGSVVSSKYLYKSFSFQPDMLFGILFFNY